MSRPVRMTAREAARLGARPRPREPKPPKAPPATQTEAGLMRACLALLKLRRVLAVRLNSGAGLREWRGRMVPVRMAPAGTADLMLLIPRPGGGCAVLFVELKSATGRQRPAQKAFQVASEAAGATYRLIRSLEDLAALLKEHGVDA